MIFKVKKRREAAEDLIQEIADPSSQTPPHRIEISSFTVLKIIGVAALVYLVWAVRDVLGILFVALVLASALHPWVNRLERFHIPRGVSILSMYFLFFCTIGLVIYLVIPPLTTQLSSITRSFAQYGPQIDSIYQYLTDSSSSLSTQVENRVIDVNSALQGLSSGLYNFFNRFFGGILAILFVLVITFYMTIEDDGLKKFLRSIAPVQYQPYIVQKINKIQVKMGAWLSGQLVLMGIIGILVFIGLSIMGVPYALVLACIAGLLEFIPFLGPVISAVPAVFFVYADSPWKAVAVIVFYVVLQQVENQIIVPKIMQKAVGLNPIVVITAMLIGAKVAGLGGILLAVPAATIIWIFLEDLFQQKKELDNRLEQPIGNEE